MQTMKTAYCKPAIGYRRDQLPGRMCHSDNNMCKSLNCVDKQCVGLELESNCFSHDDCTTATYCAVSPTWPFVSSCQKFLNAKDVCTEDAQCSIDHFCWFDSQADQTNNV